MPVTLVTSALSLVDLRLGDVSLTLCALFALCDVCVCSCPLCRYALPTTGKKVGEEQRAQQERKELHEAMFN